ncbi:hypothetical protein MSG28_015482 [Choristoneura fumiferana]|uniref:Uncharacterized protein n=1 Tax=Choristoneura fumiferana TaxID=7141 RepID=A0ACC0KAB2_CHOFU|nr:hypothetical protein MSG28_015482 [Choristoneura fumiferana]
MGVGWTRLSHAPNKGGLAQLLGGCRRTASDIEADREGDGGTIWTHQSTKKPVASCYFPVTSRICIHAANSSTGLCVLPDRCQGGTSYGEGEVELMVHRRLLTDDGFGLDETLNEEENGVGIVIRGKHRLMFGNYKQEVDELTFSERVSHASHRWQMEPWLFVTSGEKVNRRKWQNVRNKRGLCSPVDVFRLMKLTCTQYSALRLHGLPRHIRVLTLEPWKAGSVLLRLENTLEKSDRANSRSEMSEEFPKPAHITVELRKMFQHLQIKDSERQGPTDQGSRRRKVQNHIRHRDHCIVLLWQFLPFLLLLLPLLMFGGDETGPVCHHKLHPTLAHVPYSTESETFRRQSAVISELRSVRETTLAANQWLEEARQMDWSTRSVLIIRSPWPTLPWSRREEPGAKRAGHSRGPGPAERSSVPRSKGALGRQDEQPGQCSTPERSGSWTSQEGCAVLRKLRPSGLSVRYVYNGGDDGILPEDLDYTDETKTKQADNKDSGHFSDEEPDFIRRKPQRRGDKLKSKIKNANLEEEMRKKRSINISENFIDNVINNSEFDNMDNIRRKYTTDQFKMENKAAYKANVTNKDPVTIRIVEPFATNTPKSVLYRKPKQRKHYLTDFHSSEEDESITLRKRWRRKNGRKKRPAVLYTDMNTDETDDGVTKSMYEMYYKTKSPRPPRTFEEAGEVTRVKRRKKSRGYRPQVEERTESVRRNKAKQRKDKTEKVDMPFFITSGMDDFSLDRRRMETLEEDEEEKDPAIKVESTTSRRLEMDYDNYYDDREGRRKRFV